VTSFLISYAVASVVVLLFAADYSASRGKPFSQDPFSAGLFAICGPLLVLAAVVVLAVMTPLYLLGLAFGPMIRRVESRRPYSSNLAQAARQAERAQNRRGH